MLQNNPNFQLRYLITERKELIPFSWCSEGSYESTTKSLPILQYTVDGVNWATVDTVIEKE